MKSSHLLLLAAGVPLFALAQPDQVMPAAADANAPVAPLHYHSVFSNGPALKERTESPDKGWVRANSALLGNDDQVHPPSHQPEANASHQMPKPEQSQVKHEHKGTHQ